MYWYKPKTHLLRPLPTYNSLIYDHNATLIIASLPPLITALLSRRVGFGRVAVVCPLLSTASNQQLLRDLHAKEFCLLVATCFGIRSLYQTAPPLRRDTSPTIMATTLTTMDDWYTGSDDSCVSTLYNLPSRVLHLSRSQLHHTSAHERFANCNSPLPTLLRK